MAREFGPVNVEIWSDPAFRALPPAAQHLYLLLWTSPGLTYCGVHDWRPGRLAKLSQGFDADHIGTVSDCLTARHFLVIDDETEEVLVRSWARFDGLLKKPRMAVSYASAYAAVASLKLRSVLVNETQKMRESDPEWACWSDSRVTSILAHPAVSAKDLPTPSDPFADGFVDRVALGLPLVCDEFAANGSKGLPLVCPPPTPAPAPAPNSFTPLGVKSSNKAKPATQLPEAFHPTKKHQELADEIGVDLRAEWPQFCDHHRAKGSTFKDWPAALNTWIRNAAKFGRSQPPQPARHIQRAEDIELPPDGLSDAEYATWFAEQQRRRHA